jgi:hypothetical protein
MKSANLLQPLQVGPVGLVSPDTGSRYGIILSYEACHVDLEGTEYAE